MIFLLNAFLASIGLGISSGILGSLVLWRNSVYFGESIAHTAFFGVAIGILLNIKPFITVFIVAMSCSLIFSKINAMFFNVSRNAILSVITSTILALSLILFPNFGEEVTSLVFGDLLYLSSIDLCITYIISLCVLLSVLSRWDAWILSSINQDISEVEGVLIRDIEFKVLLSSFIAVSINIVGILLVSAILIIPSYTAHFMSKSPKQMILLASFLSIISIDIGLLISMFSDSPAGPSAVLVSFIVFLMTGLCKKIWH